MRIYAWWIQDQPNLLKSVWIDREVKSDLKSITDLTQDFLIVCRNRVKLIRQIPKKSINYFYMSPHTAKITLKPWNSFAYYIWLHSVINSATIPRACFMGKLIVLVKCHTRHRSIQDNLPFNLCGLCTGSMQEWASTITGQCAILEIYDERQMESGWRANIVTNFSISSGICYTSCGSLFVCLWIIMRGNWNDMWRARVVIINRHLPIFFYLLRERAWKKFAASWRIHLIGLRASSFRKYVLLIKKKNSSSRGWSWLFDRLVQVNCPTTNDLNNVKEFSSEVVNGNV